MKILIDAHMIGQQETGNETYIVNLLACLAQQPVSLAGVIRPKTILPDILKNQPIEWLVLPSDNNWRRLGYALSHLSRRWQADIMHTSYILPFWFPCKTVLTVHDVIFRRFSSFFSPRDRLLFSTLLPLSLHRADAIVTVSDNAKQEIVHFYPYVHDKVYRTWEGYSQNYHFVEKEVAQNVQERYGLDVPFILSVGNLQPRKNIQRLIRAFSLVYEDIQPAKLVIVGQAQWQASEIFKAVEDLHMTDHIVFTGYVSEDDLALLYNAASIFVYPSLFEGFGLPVLEAFACGTPTISSNTSSLPEVAGDAAIQIDPEDTNQLAKAISDLWHDKELQQILTKRGFIRAKQFSWENMAEETMGVYRNLLKA